ncbi:UTRA domain-containing protein [Streptomyces sp. MJP52]|uniref:UTRA domain-containing protein n=1 Tax=Streptomyces sp. MJP52 TaxID=2940555 RepID=UPI0024754307|nr:UTRA domain-containing protein [Streptomyces sp. MJP52]MDH6224281.1 DNA-binding GntR family transcriptional regulator [Streptomyces sp. MJP52]
MSGVEDHEGATGGLRSRRAVSPGIQDRVRTHAATGRALEAGETSRILDVGTTTADEAIASLLRVEPGSTVHFRRRLVSRDGTPVHLSTSYYASFVVEVTPELTEAVSTGGSRELAAERLEAKQGRVEEEVTYRPATEPEWEALGLDPGEGVAEVVRAVFLTDGRVVEAGMKICPGSTALRWSSSLP